MPPLPLLFLRYPDVTTQIMHRVSSFFRLRALGFGFFFDRSLAPDFPLTSYLLRLLFSFVGYFVDLLLRDPRVGSRIILYLTFFVKIV